jgi:hypothetical protein
MNKIIPVELVEHIISYVNFVHPLAELIKEHFSVFKFGQYAEPWICHQIRLKPNVYWNMCESGEVVGIYSYPQFNIQKYGFEVINEVNKRLIEFGYFTDD